MIDSDRHPISNQRPILKLASIDVIISNHGPILRSMADSLLSNRRPFESENLFVLLACHMMDVGQVCTSTALHIISNACKASKFQA
jgi:hypothetical protein